MANAHNGLLISPDETTQGELVKANLHSATLYDAILTKGIDGRREHANLSSGIRLFVLAVIKARLPTLPRAPKRT